MAKTGTKRIECGGNTCAIQMIDRGQKNIHYNLACSTDAYRVGL
jgi:hypothetical protein